MKRLKIASDNYLQELGLEFKSQNSRERNNVFVRNDFICASRGLSTAKTLGEIWGYRQIGCNSAHRRHGTL